MPNIKTKDRLAGLLDVKISEVRQQMKGNGRPRKASVTALCDFAEAFIAAIEHEERNGDKNE